MGKWLCELPVLVPNARRYSDWDGRTWVLIEGWRAEFANDRVRWGLHIDAGFVTDGGSIPTRLQGRFAPLGYHLAAYLVHDALYSAEAVERAEADWILLELLQELGANWLNRNAQYSAVRVGGAAVWRGHTTANVVAARAMLEWTYEVRP